jgi:hypothetical protein
MKKTILAAVLLAVLALAAPAAAGTGNHATTYKAKVASATDSSVRGKASLVDGKRRDKVQLHIKGLAAGATYTWAVREAAGAGDACAGAAVAALGSAELRARRKGAAKARLRARGFAAADGASYAVVITDAAGRDVACGELLRKADRKAVRNKKGSKRHSGEAEIHFDEEQQLEDDEPGDDAGADTVVDEPGDDLVASEEDDGLF